MMRASMGPDTVRAALPSCGAAQVTEGIEAGL
jgi:hypothetical protein